MSDEVVKSLREEITAIDRELVALVNRRIETVARLKRHKDEHGIAFVDPDREAQILADRVQENEGPLRIAFVDPDREAQILADRVQENEGPLSEDGLRAFYAELLALTKREL